MATTTDSHLFSNVNEIKFDPNVDLMKLKKQTIFHEFSDMFSNIVNQTPIYFNEQAVIDGHVTMKKYAGERSD
jgi:hypothetical protein